MGVGCREWGVGARGSGRGWEWFVCCHCFVLLFFVSYVVSCFLGFCSSFLQNFIKFKKVLFQTSRGPPFYLEVSSCPNTEKVNQKREKQLTT